MLDFTKPHRRRNPLTGEWVLVSPQRTQRPWQGKTEDTESPSLPEYDPTCYLCPGNERKSGAENPKYQTTFVFTNDHPAILPDVGTEIFTPNDIIEAHQVSGTSRVICYSPSHNKTMAQMTPSEIAEIIKTWTTEYATIGRNPVVSYVQIFENKGPIMGASSAHPHCQLWATNTIPTIVQLEQNNQREYIVHHHGPLLLEYLRNEHDENKRIIAENDSFTLLVPFWATWPYETMIIPKTHKLSLLDLEPHEVTSLGEILSTLTKLYDSLFNTPFPYSMGIHQAPTDNKEHDEWQMHFHFYPPLLRSATVKKYLVGYEMLAEAQRDINPEDAASTLKKLYGTK